MREQVVVPTINRTILDIQQSHAGSAADRSARVVVLAFTIVFCLLAFARPAPALAAPERLMPLAGPSDDIVHIVAQGETLWAIAVQYATTVDAIASHNSISDPGLIQIGQELVIPLPNTPGAASPVSTPSPPSLPPTATANREAGPASQQPALSSVLEGHHRRYLETALTNVRTVNGRRAVVPSPIYANGIYARDAFYAVLGSGDLDLIEETYRWFENAQNPVSGQITTAVPFDPTDDSLQPQDDETTLLFLIWSGILHRNGRPIDMEIVENAWRFVQSHVEDGQYVSPPGQFRYWADCWAPKKPDVISYNQGYYALATRFLYDIGLSGVSERTVAEAARGYRDIYQADLGFLPLSARGAGKTMQDVSALLPEALHRRFYDEGMLDDVSVRSSVEHRLATAAVRQVDGSLVGIKNIATANGGFADPVHFACPSMRRPGDYHNGGYWPMYTLVELALAFKISPQTSYQQAIEQLVERELEEGSPTEYWELSPGREGLLQPGRGDYSWNVLAVPVFRWAGLIE